MGTKYRFEFCGQPDKWEIYLERLCCYFEANDVPVDKERAVFLSVCGANKYSLLRDLLTPAKPTAKTFDELTAVLTTHYSPRPNEIVERCNVDSGRRKESETIADYVAE